MKKCLANKNSSKSNMINIQRIPVSNQFSYQLKSNRYQACPNSKGYRKKHSFNELEMQAFGKLSLKNERPEPSGRASANQSQAAGGSTTTYPPAQTEAFLDTGASSWVQNLRGG